MFRRLFLRQEATSYLLQIPFLLYFMVETFRFGHEVGFMLLLGGMAIGASVVGLILKRRVTGPLRSWIAEPGSVDVETVVRRANQLPIFDAWSVTVRYSLAGVVGGGAAVAVWGASAKEAFLLACFAFLAGGLAGTVYYFASEFEADQLLGEVPRDKLSDGVRLPIALKIPTFVFVVVGFLVGYAALVVEMLREGMIELEAMGHVYLFAFASLAYIFFGLYYFRASLIAKLANLKDRIADISAGEGDLSRTVPLGMCDEVTEIAMELNGFIAKLRSTIVQVVQTAQAVDESARAFSVAADALAHDASGMNDQSVEAAAAVEQLSAGLAAIAQSVGDVSTNVSSVASTTGGVSSAITEVAGSSQTMSVDMSSVSAAIEEMSSSLNEVAQAAARASKSTRDGSEQVHRASAQMEALEASANQVSQVVALIEEIADQTNLLALNATIEAASAGEAGRGFAVVASEVKALAKQTTGATERISSQMEKMRKDTLAALAMIREVSEHFSTVDEGSASIAAAVEQQTATVTEIASNVGRTAGAASTINDHVQGISREIGQIARRSGEMSSGADSISRSSSDAADGATQVSSQLSDMTRLVQDAAERAQGVRSRAGELTKVSQTLSGLVAQFKTA